MLRYSSSVKSTRPIHVSSVHSQRKGIGSPPALAPTAPRRRSFPMRKARWFSARSLSRESKAGVAYPGPSGTNAILRLDDRPRPIRGWRTSSRTSFESAKSSARVVQQLQELVGCELDLFVTPFRCAVMAGDDPRPMQTAEVGIDECVAGLCVVC